jgi:hypothetical protein
MSAVEDVREVTPRLNDARDLSVAASERGQRRQWPTDKAASRLTMIQTKHMASSVKPISAGLYETPNPWAMISVASREGRQKKEGHQTTRQLSQRRVSPRSLGKFDSPVVVHVRFAVAIVKLLSVRAALYARAWR